MKSVTQFAMIGTAIIIVSQIISWSTYLLHINFPENFWMIFRVFELFGYITIFAFFYKLNEKQNSKIKDDEQKRNL